MNNTIALPDEALIIIAKAFKRGNAVELKKVNGKIEVIEIHRELKIKTSV